MKKTQLLITALCASALLLGGCNNSGSKKKKSKEPSSSSSQPEKVLSSIVVDHGPTKTTYCVGESFDPAGMVVTAHYSDGTSADVTGQCTFSPSVIAENTTSVTVSYQGKTQSVAVNVIDWSAADLEVLNEFAYGVKVPFPGEGQYEFGSDYYGTGAEYVGGESSLAKINAYKARFDTTVWSVDGLANGYAGFIAEKAVSTSEGERHVSVTCYGYSQSTSSPSTDGSGVFVLEISDPYEYDWSEVSETADFVATVLGSVGLPTFVEVKDALPEFEGNGYFSFYYSDAYSYYSDSADGERYAPIYEVTSDLYIFCSESDFSSYINEIYADAKWEYEGSDTYGQEYYAYADNLLEICCAYNPNYSVGYLIFEQCSATAFPETTVASYISAFRDSFEAFPAFNVGAQDYALFTVEDFSTKYIVDVYSESISAASLNAYAASIDTEKFEVSQNEASWSVTALDGSYSFSADFYAAESEDSSPCVEFVIEINLPHLEDYPSALADAYFAAEGYTVEDPIAPYVPAEPGYYYTYAPVKDGGGDIYVYGSSTAEMGSYVDDLVDQGWVASQDSYGDYVLRYGDDTKPHPALYVADYTAYPTENPYGYILVEFYIEAALAWTDEEKASFIQVLDGYVPQYNEYFSSFSLYTDSETGGYFFGGYVFDNVLTGVNEILVAEGFVEGTGYTDEDSIVHHVYSKATAHGSVFYDVYAYEFMEDAYVTQFELYFEASAA